MSSKDRTFDHSDLTDEERKAKGLETEAEAVERIEKQQKEVKVPKTSKTTKAKTGKTTKAPQAKAKTAKAPKAKKADDKRSYTFHKGTKDDPKTVNCQSGARQDTDLDDLNDKEKRVLAVIKRHPGIEYPDLVEKANLGPEKKKASWTRNALRRLVRDGFVTKPEAGVYKPGRRAA